MKKIIIVLLTALSPILTYAQEAQEVVEETSKTSNFVGLAFMVMAVAFIFMAVVFLIIRSTDQKSEILNSNIARVKSELRMKGYHPENALIDILHRESSLYSGPPEPIVITQDAAPRLETAALPTKEEVDHSLVLSTM